MAKITDITGLSFYRYIFSDGILNDVITGTYDRNFENKLDVYTSQSMAYDSDGNRDTEQDGEVETGFISSFSCKIPYTANVKETWSISIGGGTEVYNFSDQKSALKEKYYESHERYDGSSISVEKGSGEESGYADGTYINLPANRSENYLLHNVIMESEKAVAQSESKEVWQVPMTSSITDTTVSYDYSSDVDTVPYSGGDVIVYVNNIKKSYTRVWADGYNEEVSGESVTPSSITVNVYDEDDPTTVIASGTNKGTLTNAEFHVTIPTCPDDSGRSLRARIVVTSDKEYGNTIRIEQSAKVWNAPVIIGIYSIADIPASGGSVSSCVVSYTQTSNAGDSIQDTAYVEFSAISAYSLGTSETTARTWRGSADVTITKNEKTSAAYTINVYQAINAITKREYSSFSFSLPWSTYTIPAKGGSNADLTPTSVSQTVDYTYTSTATKKGVAVSVDGHYTTYWSNDSTNWSTTFADVSWSKDSRGTTLVESDQYLGHIYVKLVGDSSCGSVSTTSSERKVYFQHNTKDSSTYSNPWVSLTASSATLTPNGSDYASASVSSVGQSIKYTWTSGSQDADWTAIPLNSYTAYYGTSASPTSTAVAKITAEDIGADVSDAKTLGTIYVRIKSADSGLYSSDATMVVYQKANEITNRAYSAFSFSLPWSTYTIPAKGGSNASLSPSNVTQTVDYTYTNSSTKKGVSVTTSGHYTTYWSNDSANWSTTFADKTYSRDTRGTTLVESDEYIGHIYVRLIGDSSCGSITTTSGACNVYFQHNTKDSMTWEAPTLSLTSASATLIPNGTDSASASVKSVGQRAKYTWTSGVTDGDWTSIPLTSYTTYYGKSASPTSTTSVTVTSENAGAAYLAAKTLATIYVRIYSQDSKLYSSDATMTINQAENKVVSSTYATRSIVLALSTTSVSAGETTITASILRYKSCTDTYTNGSTNTYDVSTPDTVSSPYSYITASPSTYAKIGTDNITIYQNSTTSARTITFTATYDGVSGTASVNQSGATATYEWVTDGNGFALRNNTGGAGTFRILMRSGGTISGYTAEFTLSNGQTSAYYGNVSSYVFPVQAEKLISGTWTVVLSFGS